MGICKKWGYKCIEKIQLKKKKNWVQMYKENPIEKKRRGKKSNKELFNFERDVRWRLLIFIED